MSSRPFIKQYSVITDGDMSGNITSSATVIPTHTIGSYSYSWVGSSPVGTLSVEISNDYVANESPDGKAANAGTWNTMYVSVNGGSPAASVPLSGNTGNGIIEWSTGAAAIRTKFTFTSGTGTLQAVVNCKVA